MSNVQQWWREAKEAEAAGDKAAARRGYEAIVAAQPSAARAVIALCRLDLEAGRATAALELLERVKSNEIEPDVLVDFGLTRAATLRLLGRYEDEFEALQTTLAIDPYCWPALLQNDFEESVFKAHPKIAQLKSELEKTSACYVSMSGSGASVFALYNEEYEVPSSLKSALLAKFYL